MSLCWFFPEKQIKTMIYFKTILKNIHKKLNTSYMPYTIKLRPKSLLLFTEYKFKDARQGLIILLTENYLSHN